MLSQWYKLLDKEKTDQDPFSFQETAQQKETISWVVGTRSFLRHHLRCPDFRKRKPSCLITKFSLSPPGLRDAQRARPRKRLRGEVGLRYGVRWLQQVLVGRNGEQRIKKLLCVIELHWVSSGRKQKQLWNKRRMRWDLRPSRRQTGICKHPTSFVNRKLVSPFLTRLATYPWCRDPAKALTSTMVTIQNEGFVNNSNMAVALVSWSSRSCKCIIELLHRKQQQVQNNRGVRRNVRWKRLQADADRQMRAAHWTGSMVRYQPIFVFFSMLSDIYQPIFVSFNALRYISADLLSLYFFSAGNFTRYGYDKETETCEEFNYGGCKGGIDMNTIFKKTFPF